MANTAEAGQGGGGGGFDGRKLLVESAAHSYAENVRHARSNIFIMLLAQLYCLITIETTQDAALLSNSTTQKLPILETSISIETFYILAPLLLLILFFHFQIHLKSIWRSATKVSKAENVELIELVDTFPWFITSAMARRFSLRESERGGFSGWFEYNVGLLFGWFSTAIVIFMMWARYLTKHDWSISIYHAAVVSMAVCAAVYFLYSSKSSLQGISIRGWRILSRTGTVLLSFLLPFAALCYGTWWLFEAQDRSGCQNSYTDECSAIFLLRDRLKLAGLDPAAALDGADVSFRPEGWAPESAADLARLSTVRGANLRGEDLRYASAKNALFVRADLRGATLRLGDFEGAFFQGADLSGADLSFSSFENANFDHAIFAAAEVERAIDFLLPEREPAEETRATDAWGQPARRARANEVVLDSADMTGASFFKARIISGRGSDVLFSQANFSGATAQGCWFANSDFREARFSEASFSDCDFEGASFFAADMRKASFAASRLADVELGEVNFEGGSLSGAKLKNVSALRANLVGLDLYRAEISDSHIDQAKLDDAVLSEVQITGGGFRDTVFRRADFRKALITGSDLSGSDLSEAILYGAKLDEVDMTYVRLQDADLSGANLETALNLTQDQLDGACGDRSTKLPRGLSVMDCAEKLASQ